MPFTFSHPAVVLPFTKSRWFSATGLIIGSMVPDAEYYIRMKDERLFTHNWHGLLWYDLPAGIIIAFLFHNVVRNALIFNLPYRYRARLIHFKKFNWNACFKNNWLIIILSILFGGASHFFIDSFCKENGYFALRIPLLTGHYHVGNFVVEGWFALQIVTSLAGLIIIYLIIKKLPLDSEPANINRNILPYWICVIAITALVCFIKILFADDFKPENFIIPVITGLLLAVLITPFILRWLLNENYKT